MVSHQLFIQSQKKALYADLIILTYMTDYLFMCVSQKLEPKFISDQVLSVICHYDDTIVL